MFLPNSTYCQLRSFPHALLAASLLLPCLSSSAQSSASPSISQSSGFGPTNFYDGRPALQRYATANNHITFDEHFNTRFEIRNNNNDFNSKVNGPQDSDWLITRFRLGALFQVNQWFKFYLQGQDIREIGGKRPNNVGIFGADGDDYFDLLQGWAAIGDENHGLSLRAGRQGWNYGNQRLLGNPQWKNSTIVWDSIKLHYQASSWFMDLFSGSPVSFLKNKPNTSDYFNVHEPRNAVVTGAYFSSAALIPWQSSTDFYLLNYMANKAPVIAGPPIGAVGNTNVWTLGTLWKGDLKKLHNWDYEMELDLQFGQAGGLAQQAFAGHWAVGYNFQDPWKTRIGFQYNYASGDGNAADGKTTTFQNLFPGNHALYGFMDTTAYANLSNPQLNITLQPTEKLKVTFDAMAFFNATNSDAWYGANTTTAVRPLNAAATSASSKYRGAEFDINAWYKINPHVTLQAGYAMFLAGSYLAQTGAHSTAHFGYTQMTLHF